MDIKNIIAQRKDVLKKQRHKNYELYLDGEFIKAFQDRYQRERYINTKSFELLSKDKVIEFLDRKVYKKK